MEFPNDAGSLGYARISCQMIHLPFSRDIYSHTILQQMLLNYPPYYRPL